MSVHRLARVDRPRPEQHPKMRRAVCHCGDVAYCATYARSVEWASLHREHPGLPPGALAQLERSR